MIVGSKLDRDRVCPPRMFITENLSTSNVYVECSSQNDLGLSVCKQMLFKALRDRHSSIKNKDQVEEKVITPP